MRRIGLLVVGLIGWLGVSVTPLVARADSYPSRPIRIVVGFAAGGLADVTVRIIGQRLGELLGQQLVIDNRPSAGGVIAAEAVASAAPDGYTLLVTSNGTAVSRSLFKSLPFDPVTDFASVSTLGYFDVIVLTKAESPIRTIADLIAAARAQPGAMTIGTINPGSSQHLSAELFKSAAGIDALTIPFRTSPAVVTALLGGDIQVAFEMLAPVRSQIESGALRAIAVSSERRFPRLPAVPTVQESGLPSYQVSSWNAIVAPARTPPEVIQRLNRDINRVVEMPEVRQSLLDIGVDARGSTPEALQQLLVSEIAKWQTVIEHAGIERQ